LDVDPVSTQREDGYASAPELRGHVMASTTSVSAGMVSELGDRQSLLVTARLQLYASTSLVLLGHLLKARPHFSREAGSGFTPHCCTCVIQ